MHKNVEYEIWVLMSTILLRLVYVMVKINIGLESGGELVNRSNSYKLVFDR